MNTNSKIAVLACLLCIFLCTNVAHAFSWAPVDPNELKMTSEPKAPGASAIILEKQVDRDDAWHRMSVYVRIKVLTEEGRRYGNVEIPYEKNSETVLSIQARTIKPDGRIIEFDGAIFDRLIVKEKGARYQVKTFSLPEVETGSIIEFHYVHYLSGFYLYSQLILREEFFVKHGKYSLAPNDNLGLTWSWPKGLPPGTVPPSEKSGRITLETHDVPAFVTEDYMPPADELKFRIDFVYNRQGVPEKIPASYWRAFNTTRYQRAKNFMDERKTMEKVIARVVEPTDSTEQKLRKLYAHVQQLRNLSYEKEKTAQETERDKIKDVDNVADIEKYGYGNSAQLIYLYTALVRTAGFTGDIVYVANRDRFFFQPELMNASHLNSMVVVITVDGKEIYVDPGVPFVPFGLIPWYESGVSGLRINKEGGVWVKTPVTKPSQAQTVRKANFKLEDGTLTGNVIVTYTGLDAIYHRLSERLDDDVARKEYMQEELKRAIPIRSDVTVTNAPDWIGAEAPLVVEYKVTIPGWATSAGKRLLIPIGLFGNEDKHTFEQEKRIHPVYFHYHNIVDDEITIDVPSSLQLTSTPKGRDENIAWMTYSSSIEPKNNVIKIKRNLAINGVYMPEKYYLALREFYQNVRANDEQQIVLAPVVATSGEPAKNN